MRAWIAHLGLALPLLLSGCSEDDPGRQESLPVWYSTQPGEKHGPISRGQLERAIEQKRLPPDVMLWTAEGQQWVPWWEFVDPLLDFDPPSPDASGRGFQRLCDRAAQISERDAEVLAGFVAAIQTTPSSEVRSVLVRHFDLLRDARGGMQEVGEIGLDYAQGFELLLPHARSARILARLLAADARMQSEEDNLDTAAQDCAAIARLARQIAADRTVVSSTVSMSLAVLFAEELRRLLDEGALSPKVRRTIIESSQWLRGDDPFTLEEALRVEKVFTVAWAENQLREGRADQSFHFPPGITGDEIRGGLAAETARSREAFDVLIAAVADRRVPDPDRLTEIEHRILSGDFGALANMLVLVSPARQVIDTLRRIDPVFDRLASDS